MWIRLSPKAMLTCALGLMGLAGVVMVHIGATTDHVERWSYFAGLLLGVGAGMPLGHSAVALWRERRAEREG